MSKLNIHQVMEDAASAFESYRKIPSEKRASFLETIASELEKAGDALLELASGETNLPLPRLRGELGRTCFQLRMFAAQVRDGQWVDAIINHANPAKTPPAPDVRSMQIPIGPVVVFGASNFPFAYSTVGGDTASALAAGCPVIVKQHPAHAGASKRVFEIAQQVAAQSGFPPGTIQHVEDAGFETGKALVQHPATAAVGFTGSYQGGMALLEYSRQRKNPIPVFAEMGSTNPVLLLPGALATQGEDIAQKLVASFTLSMGQFCTNPGLMMAVQSEELDAFTRHFTAAMHDFSSTPMLHQGIYKSYLQKTEAALAQQGVTLLQSAGISHENGSVPAMVSKISGKDFLANPLVHEEIFGPWTLLVVCDDATELLACRKAVAGQLTTSLWGTNEDFEHFPELIDEALMGAGRVVFNGAPTGVEVCAAMVHGGPHPATTDGRFTAVGPMAIRRWTRPVCWQNAPDFVLPPALQESNPLNLLRLVDGQWIK